MPHDPQPRAVALAVQVIRVPVAAHAAQCGLQGRVWLARSGVARRVGPGSGRGRVYGAGTWVVPPDDSWQIGRPHGRARPGHLARRPAGPAAGVDPGPGARWLRTARGHPADRVEHRSTSYREPDLPSGRTNWLVLGGIVAVVVLVALLLAVRTL